MKAIEKKILRGDILKALSISGVGVPVSDTVIRRTLELASYEISEGDMKRACQYLDGRFYLTLYTPEHDNLVSYTLSLTSAGQDVVDSVLYDDGVDISDRV